MLRVTLNGISKILSNMQLMKLIIEMIIKITLEPQ